MSTLYKDFFNSLYEETLYEINSFRLKEFVESLGFDYVDVSNDTDTHATIVKDDTTYVFFAEDKEASLSIINNIGHNVLDQIWFKFENGEWNETEDNK